MSGLANTRTSRRKRGAAQAVRVGVLRVAVLIVLLGAWQVLALTRVLNPLYFSMPTAVLQQMATWLATGVLLDNLWVTFSETLLGWAIAAMLGVVTGYLAALNKTADAVVAPFVNAFQAAPRLALVPLLVIWFGLGPPSKVALVVTVVFSLVFIATNSSAKTVDQDLVTVARTLGANRFEMATKVVWPWCLPFIFSSLQVGLSLGLTSAVVGEMIIAQKGLGALIAHESGGFNSTGVLAGVTTVMVVAYVLSLVNTAIERRLLNWRPEGLLS